MLHGTIRLARREGIMIETEKQRRWWFATHPEYSSDSNGRSVQKHGEDESRVSPEGVDAYVDKMLKYERDEVVIQLLKSTKRWFGTAGQNPESYAELGLEWPGEARSAVRFAGGEHGSSNRHGGEGSENAKDEEKREPTFLDSILKGSQYTLELWQRLLGWGGVRPRPPSSLARNMEKAGRPRPQGHAAHHIVPLNDSRFKEAIKAREILRNFEIDIDNAVNGVWLRYKAISGNATYHPSVHTGTYYIEVLRLLRQAKTRKEAIRTLERIGRMLSKGTFPR